jgi:hypothetical protein
VTPRRATAWACGWCAGPVYAVRADARYCSKRCRQAAHRARLPAGTRAPVRDPSPPDILPRRLAYADPPYPGKAHLYRDQASYAGEVDHAELLRTLATYDGWALHTSARALPMVLNLAAAEGQAPRVAAWLRGARPHARARVVSAWEPVLYVPARTVVSGSARPIPDALAAASRRRPTLPGAVIGMKPPAVAAWVFQLLGAEPGDSLDDLYPGSGIVTRTWQLYAGRDPARLTYSPAVDARPLPLELGL